MYESIVKVLRDLSSHPEDKKVDLDSIINKIDDLSIQYGVSDIADGKIEKNNGKYQISISSQKDEISDRDRFTIAHELGHLFLRHLDENGVLHREGKNQIEYQANQFAAELLMPEDMFKEELLRNKDGITCDINSMSQIFGVSPSAIVTRGKFLGVFEW